MAQARTLRKSELKQLIDVTASCSRYPQRNVTVIDTGQNTLTGGRLKRVSNFVKNEEAFCFTYGDGLADIDIAKEIEFHKSHGKLATVAAVEPPGRFGAIERNGSQVIGFSEKPRGDGGVINGGFFCVIANMYRPDRGR